MGNKETMRKTAFDREHCRYFRMKFNRHTDAEIIARLESMPNIQGYVRRLIREDMEKEKEKELDIDEE